MRYRWKIVVVEKRDHRIFHCSLFLNFYFFFFVSKIEIFDENTIIETLTNSSSTISSSISSSSFNPPPSFNFIDQPFPISISLSSYQYLSQHQSTISPSSSILFDQDDELSSTMSFEEETETTSSTTSSSSSSNYYLSLYAWWSLFILGYLFLKMRWDEIKKRYDRWNLKREMRDEICKRYLLSSFIYQTHHLKIYRNSRIIICFIRRIFRF